VERAIMKVRPLYERIRVRRMLAGSAKPHVVAIARELAAAAPDEQVLVEREGLPASLVSNLAEAMDMPRVRFLEIMALPRASMEKKIAGRDNLSGIANVRTLNLLSLLAKARDIVEDSVASEAKDFDVAGWLGRWIETPQPALGGKRPSDLLDTEVGARMVERTLGALRSDTYL
jgi:putative toxin-antitoxin system antitoxin component (TIGR02293 family)